MISLCARQYDSVYSPVLLRPDPGAELRSSSRRVSRTASLDGGCVMTDHGVSHSDRNLEMSVTGPSAELVERIWGLYVTYSLIRVAQHDGVYTATISRFRHRENQLSITILIKEKLT